MPVRQYRIRFYHGTNALLHIKQAIELQSGADAWVVNPIQPGGVGVGVGGTKTYRIFPCCAETACSRLMKLSDF